MLGLQIFGNLANQTTYRSLSAVRKEALPNGIFKMVLGDVEFLDLAKCLASSLDHIHAIPDTLPGFYTTKAMGPGEKPAGHHKAN